MCSGLSPRRPLVNVGFFPCFYQAWEPAQALRCQHVSAHRVWGQRGQEPGRGWAAGWKGRMRWRDGACRSWGGGRGKLDVLGAGAEVWDHEYMLSLGLGAEPWSPYFSPVSEHLWTTAGHVCLLSPSAFCVILQEVTQWSSAGQRYAVAPGKSCSFSQAGDALIPPPSQDKNEGGIFPRKRLHHKTVKHLPSGK